MSDEDNVISMKDRAHLRHLPVKQIRSQTGESSKQPYSTGKEIYMMGENGSTDAVFNPTDLVGKTLQFYETKDVGTGYTVIAATDMEDGKVYIFDMIPPEGSTA